MDTNNIARRDAQRKRFRRISNALISIGLALVLAVGIYSAANYPWTLLFSRWGLTELPDDLPDPAPLPVAARTPTIEPTPVGAEGEPEGMPEELGLFATRPEMNLTWLGILKLPKIQISENIVEGSGDEMLYAVGHVRGTALPGEEGNCVLSGHRNYVMMHPFRHLDMMEVGDVVTIANEDFVYTYEVFKTFVVTPQDTWVMEPQEEESHLLTMLTCTPVINPTHRQIIWCRLTNTLRKY